MTSFPFFITRKMEREGVKPEKMEFTDQETDEERMNQARTRHAERHAEREAILGLTLHRTAFDPEEAKKDWLKRYIGAAAWSLYDILTEGSSFPEEISEETKTKVAQWLRDHSDTYGTETFRDELDEETMRGEVEHAKHPLGMMCQGLVTTQNESLWAETDLKRLFDAHGVTTIEDVYREQLALARELVEKKWDVEPARGFFFARGLVEDAKRRLDEPLEWDDYAREKDRFMAYVGDDEPRDGEKWIELDGELDRNRCERAYADALARNPSLAGVWLIVHEYGDARFYWTWQDVRKAVGSSLRDCLIRKVPSKGEKRAAEVASEEEQPPTKKCKSSA